MLGPAHGSESGRHARSSAWERAAASSPTHCSLATNNVLAGLGIGRTHGAEHLANVSTSLRVRPRTQNGAAAVSPSMSERQRGGLGVVDIRMTTQRSACTAFAALIATERTNVGRFNEPQRRHEDSPVEVSEAGQYLMEHQQQHDRRGSGEQSAAQSGCFGGVRHAGPRRGNATAPRLYICARRLQGSWLPLLVLVEATTC